MSEVRFIKRSGIDRQKWNTCVAGSVNSLPYAFTWYLDAVAENWDGLVYGDYDQVMPLVWLRKFGIKCLYQPYYCQQLGVFGKDLSNKMQRGFLNYIRQNYAYISINLNPSVEPLAGEYKLTRKKNLFLDLTREYAVIKKKYVENHLRNIQKAVKAQVIFSEETRLDQFQKFYLENVNRKQENFKAKHEKIFRQLTKTVIGNSSGKVVSVISTDGKLLAAAILIQHMKRIINIINTSSVPGKRTGASHYLFDQILHQFSGTDNVFDFEGSSIPGIARFYEGFGAGEETFYNYRLTAIGKFKQLFL